MSVTQNRPHLRDLKWDLPTSGDSSVGLENQARYQATMHKVDMNEALLENELLVQNFYGSKSLR